MVPALQSPNRVRHRLFAFLGPGLFAASTGAFAWQASTVSAQDLEPAVVIELSLDDALTRAVESSEEVRLARAQVDIAGADVTAARSAALPQVSFTSGYARTFQSAFTSGVRQADLPAFRPDPSAPVEERLRYLEQNVGLAAASALGGLFGGDGGGGLPFGRAHAYSVSLNAQQLLYSGGRVRAAIAIARTAREAAELALVEETADIQLQVRSAYFQALLANELDAIAQAALVQAQSFLDQERIRQRAGYASDLDVLRAEVSLENIRPQTVQARNVAELALLDLRRLINLPLNQPLRLTTPLLVPTARELAQPELRPEVRQRQRAAVQAAERQVTIRVQNVRRARGTRWPSVSLQMAYGGQAFPDRPFDLGSADWQPDWTATLGVQMPVFTGFRLQAEVERARVEVREAELQLAQLEEIVELQYQQARGEKERARASIAARQRTVDQAQRVYDLTVLRYGQGQATQLEVSDARLELLQARSNLAQALADFYIADAGIIRTLTGSVPVPTQAPTSASPPQTGVRP